VDLPGTGESPLAVAEVGADRLFSAALDFLAMRADVDAGRIVVQGRSWSGYWAAKLAVTERERLRGSVMHGGPIHHYFQPDWLARSLATGEYLYDYLLLEHGDAKEAWINPRGGHMGRSPEWPSARIAEQILIPWIARRLT
jgi:esterase FrsA